MESTSYLDTVCPIHQTNAVKSVKAITAALYQGSDLDLIRSAIAELMAQQLQRGKDANNETARSYFVLALGSLTINVTTKNRSSSVGLYPCLIDLENAIDILDGKESKHPRIFEQRAEQLSYQFLLEALEAMRQSPTFQDKR
ncbi:MAG: hypothetical protein ACXU7Z_15705 [Burkholderiaceae bacterium]